MDRSRSQQESHSSPHSNGAWELSCLDVEKSVAYVVERSTLLTPSRRADGATVTCEVQYVTSKNNTEALTSSALNDRRDSFRRGRNR